MEGLLQTIFPGTRLSNFAPPGLLENLSDEERERLQSQTTQAIFQGAFNGNVQETQRNLRERFAGRLQRQQKAQQFGGLLTEAVNSGRLDMTRARAINQLGPEEGLKILTEQFTLTPGDLRGDVLGQVAAQPTQDIQEFQQAQRDGSFQGGFRDFQDRNETTNVSAGQAVISPDGRLIFQQPTTDQQNQNAGIETGSGPTQREQEIADLQRLFGLSEAEAVARVGQFINRSQDPQSGRSFILNELEGTQTPVRTVGTGAPAEDRPPNTSVDPRTDVQDTFGIPGAFRRAANFVTDLSGFGAVAPDTDRARTELNNFNQAAKLKIADNVTDGRRSNLLLEMLDSLTADPASIFQGSENARNRLEAMDRLLRQEIENKRVVVDNQFENRAIDVQRARRSINSLTGLRADLDLLINGFGRDGALPDQGEIGSPPPNSGITPEEWRLLTPEERRQANDVFGAGQ